MDATGSPMSASVPTMGSSLNLGTSVGLKQGFKRQPSLAGFKERSLGPTHPTLLPPQWGWLCLLFESHQIKHIVSPFNQTTEEFVFHTNCTLVRQKVSLEESSTYSSWRKQCIVLAAKVKLNISFATCPWNRKIVVVNIKHVHHHKPSVWQGARALGSTLVVAFKTFSLPKAGKESCWWWTSLMYTTTSPLFCKSFEPKQQTGQLIQPHPHKSSNCPPMKKTLASIFEKHSSCHQ